MGLAARFPAAAALWVLLGTCAQLPAVAAVDANSGPVLEKPQAIDQFALDGPAIQGGLLTGTAPHGATQIALDGVTIEIAADRRFLIGFDRDAGASATLTARLDTGREIVQIVPIGPRAWNLSRLDTLPKYPVPRPEFERVRPGELAQINAARAVRSDSQGWRQDMVWPVVGRISTLFGSQRIYRGEPGAYHSGIDIARPTGTPVLSPADGVVVLAAARPFTLEGNLLMIDHGGGLNSAFMHLSRIDVRVGDRVRRGQPIGAVGRTGRATGPHLHWSLKWRDARVDPLLHAGPMPIAG